MAEPANRRAVIDAVYATGRYELQTKGGCGCFTEECAFQLAKLEPGFWFHLKKSGGQNQWNGHAVDAVLHASGYAIDIIGSSETPNAKPGWTVDRTSDGGPRYANRPDLRLPADVGCQGGGAPPTDTHTYDGGGNDTGTCDRCGRHRSDAIHRTPESLEPHAYDGGEQDTGQCDICQQPRSAAIHGDEEPPEPPDTEIAELKARVSALEATVSSQAVLLREQSAAIARLTDRVQVLEDQPAGELPPMVAEGSTGRSFGHSHPVSLVVRKL